MKKKEETVKKPDVNTDEAARALEYLFAAGYVDKKKLYFQNFVRGIFFSIGSIVGLAVAVTLILWILSFFDGLPFINDISNAIENSVK